MMKSLAQIEPRIDVLKLSSDANNLFVINTPGSYYLTTNIVGVAGKNGISIASGNVTLDLNGFTVMGTPNAIRGIVINGSFANITVRNGIVSSWANVGVDGYYNGTPSNLVFEHLTVYANFGSGIASPSGTVVRDCIVQSNFGDGIFANGGLVSGCMVRDNTGNGISMNSAGLVRDCLVLSSGTYGIYATPATVSGCVVQGSTKSGVFVNAPGSLVIDNNLKSNNTSGSALDAGIYVNDNRSRIENNHVTSSGHSGIKVNNSIYSDNVVIRNTVSGNTNVANNYLGTSGNDFGPVGSAATATSSWANISH